MKIATLLIACIFLATVSADFLQNPDFESPPSNWNSTSPDPLSQNSTIPGWSFQGQIRYVTAASDNNGHAILLGDEGKINQTFTADGEEKQYILSFNLARSVGNCTANASVVVSAPDSSAQFSLTLKYGKEPSEVYGQLLGSFGGGETVNLVIGSEGNGADPKSTCWPVVDGLALVAVGSLKEGNDNLLPNGGFETGPAFPESSKTGVLLDAEPSLVESALQQWTVTGTIKYINAKNYFVPQGTAAIELVSGASSGVQTEKQLVKGSNYILEFMLGDANDSCSGDFTVGVTAGSMVAQNFTHHSNGTGSAQKFSVEFPGVGPSPSPIIFQSYRTMQAEDGSLCGPVIDAVVLRRSGGRRSSVSCGFVIALILLVLIKISDRV